MTTTTTMAGLRGKTKQKSRAVERSRTTTTTTTKTFPFQAITVRPRVKQPENNHSKHDEIVKRATRCHCRSRYGAPSHQTRQELVVSDYRRRRPKPNGIVEGCQPAEIAAGTVTMALLSACHRASAGLVGEVPGTAGQGARYARQAGQVSITSEGTWCHRLRRVVSKGEGGQRRDDNSEEGQQPGSTRKKHESEPRENPVARDVGFCLRFR